MRVLTLVWAVEVSYSGGGLLWCFTSSWTGPVFWFFVSWRYLHVDGSEGSVGDGAADSAGEGESRVEADARQLLRLELGLEVLLGCLTHLVDGIKEL